jgi:hypothetical protein
MANFLRIAALAASVSALSLAGAASAATLVGATTIKVTSAYPDWLQIGEILAFDTGNSNVALNGITATSPHVGTYGLGASVAVDGAYPAAYPNIWHSDTPNGSEFFDVTFAGGPANLKGITIYGRNPCCETYGVPERDKYNVTVFNGQGDTLWSGVLDATGNNIDASASVSFVPEPAAWAMLIAGFGLVGATMRRRHMAHVAG